MHAEIPPRVFLAVVVSGGGAVLLNVPWRFQLISAAFETLIRINEADAGRVCVFFPIVISASVVDFYTVETLIHTVLASVKYNMCELWDLL